MVTWAERFEAEEAAKKPVKRTFAEEFERMERQEAEKGRWICKRCVSVHHYRPTTCAKCDSSTHIQYCPTGTLKPFWGIEEGDMGWRAKRLFRLRECNLHLTMAEILARPDLLEYAGLADVQLTEAVIHQAELYSIDLAADVEEKMRRIRAYSEFRPAARQTSYSDSTPVKGESGIKVAERAVEGKRSKIFDYPITAVIRWMGKEGWSKQDCLTVLTAMGIDMASSTIAIQLRAGKTGERGEPANLNSLQVKELQRFLKK